MAWMSMTMTILQRTHYVGPNAMWSKKCHSRAQLWFPRPMDGMDVHGDHHLATDPFGVPTPNGRQEDVITNPLP